ncbi:hypothetical protein KJ611_00805 [Patescibacteria group bacterium]|nr:hypothetical protein [Patescibacteria group bacterium]
MKPPAFILKAGQYQDQENDAKFRSCLILLPFRKRNGYIFALAKVEKKHARELRNICRILTSQANRLAPAFEQDSNAQHTFEQFLANLNQQLTEQIRAGAWHFPIEDFHAVVGLACEQEMYLSGTGELSTIFLHRTESQRYQIFNLARNINTEQALPTWEKTFSVILDGDLATGDIFCLASHPLSPTISNDELHEILTTLPAESAATKIRQYFSHDTALSVLVLQAQDTQTKLNASGVRSVALPQHSIEHLEATQAQTAKLLKDQKPGGLISLLKSQLKKFNGQKENQTPLRQKIFSRLRQAGLWLARHYLITKIKGHLSHRSTRAGEKISAVKQRAVHALDHMQPDKKSFPRSAKYLIFAALSVLIILAVSIYFLSQTKVETQEVENFQNQIQEINSLIEQGAAAMIYKDENQARGFYLQAQTLVQNLPQETVEQIDRSEQMKQEINGALDQLRHIVKIPEPPLIANFSAYEDFIRAQTFSFFNGQLYLFTNNKEVYAANLAEKKLELVETTAGTIGIPLASAHDDSGILILDNRPGISEFNPAQKTLRITDLAPAENNQWLDLKLYGDNLYLLQIDNQANDGQIIRLSRSGQNYSGPTQWIKSKSTNLQNAASVAIDGTIFVLKEDGQIIRFARSSEIGWEADLVEPAISKATKIWTDVNSDYLYVLEPLGKRVIVYQKESGQFISQYYFETLNNLRDFQIDETNRTIYLLTDQALYAADLSH